MTNSPTPLETAIEQTELYKTKPHGGWVIPQSTIDILLLAAKQLSALRQNSVAKSVWDETHAKYLEVAAENEGLKIRLRALGAII